MVRRVLLTVILLAFACGPARPTASRTPRERELVAAGEPARATLGRGVVARWKPLPPGKPFVVERVFVEDQGPHCAVSKDGEVACWGRLDPAENSPTELRLGTGVPLLLDGVSDASAVISKNFDLCVAQRSGTGRCFKLEVPDDPALAFPGPPVQFVRREYAVCARLRDGSVGCVGRREPYENVLGIAGATDLACTGATCCAATAAGTRCFGTANEALGIAASKVGRALDGIPQNAVEIALKDSGACVRQSNGGAHCWGKAKGLSHASGVRRVVTFANEVCVLLEDGGMSCADSHAPRSTDVIDAMDRCLVHRDGRVSCYGDNTHGDLGDGHAVLSTVPLRVGNFSDAHDLRVAHTTSCATTTTGTVWCWGGGPLAEMANAPGQLVVGQYVAGCRLAPPKDLRCMVPVTSDRWERKDIDLEKAPAPIKSIAIDRDGSRCVADGAGQIACQFGMGYNGVDARWTALPAPAPVAELRPIALGFCARLVDGRVSCFVDERHDDDARYLDALPKNGMQIAVGIDDAAELATGSNSACVVTRAGAVRCWRIGGPTVVDLPMIQGATAIAGNERHFCAVVRGEVWCWGVNDAGQFGNGTLGRRVEELPPTRAKTNFKATRVGVGRESTCALDEQGRVFCWGGDVYGELGQGRPLRSEKLSSVVRLGPM